MGTGNFYYKNASKVFAICMSREVPVLDEEGNETDEMETQHPEQWEVKDTLDNIREEMKKEAYRFYPDDSWNHDAPRSFPSRNIGEWQDSKEYAGVEISLTIKAMSNSGYYEGACLDWEVILQVNGSEMDEVYPEDLSYYGNVNKGLAKVIAEKANKWVNSTKEELINALETLFAESCGMVLQKVATFSNGETIYEKA